MLYCFQSWSEEELGNVLQKLFSGKNQISNYKKVFHKGLSSSITFYVKKLMCHPI